MKPLHKQIPIERHRVVFSFVMIFLPYFILISAGIYGIYYQQSSNNLEILKLRIQHALQQQQIALKTDLQTVMLDSLILGNHKELIDFTNKKEQTGQGLVDKFLAFSRVKKTYDQIRIINEQGWETLRINLSPVGNPYYVPQESLQDKSHTIYFKETMLLSESEMFVSDFELNIERKKIEIPAKPVIRVSMPLFDKSGNRKGMLVVNYLAEPILRKIVFEANSILIGTPMLLNSEGCWILGPNRESSWNCQLEGKKELSLNKTDPKLWKEINKTESGTLSNEKGLYFFASSTGELEQKYQSEFSVKKRSNWKLLIHVPKKKLLQSQYDLIKVLLVIYLVLILLVAVGSFYLLKIRGEQFQTLKSLLESENQRKLLDEFQERNPHPVVCTDSNGIVIFSNSAAHGLMEMIQLNKGAKLPNLVWKKVQTSLQSRSIVSVETPDHQKVYSILAIAIDKSDLTTIYAWEVTEQKRYEEQVMQMASVFDNTLEGITITDLDGNIERVNPGFETITGYSEDEVIGKNPRILKSNKHNQSFYKSMWDSLIEKDFWRGEIWNRRKNGEVYPEWLSITVIRNYQGKVSHYVGVFHDISELKRNEEELEFRAFHDALTKLPNRILFNDRLETSIANAKRNDQKLAVLFMDLDNFKNINDSLGHYAGDLLLQEVSQRLKTCAREEDTVARMGGDEFTMIIRDIEDDKTSVEIANRILSSISKVVEIQCQELYVSTSVGITIYPFDGENAETLTKNADMAMYKAKESGKNSYAFFTPDIQQSIVRRITLEHKLREAIQNEEFVLYYQPKVDAITKRIIGAEALVRWYQDGEIVPPDEFIPLAEQTGLILPLGDFILKEACQQTKIWYDSGLTDFQVAVNLSASQFQDDSLIGQISKILEETDLPARALNLEITENILMIDVQTAIETITRLSELDISISLDDFGTGYSSLSYLKQFSLDVLKIDKSFVMGLPDDADDAAIAKMVIALAKNLNLTVVAEGVETLEQLSFLKENQCDEIQGYLFSRPLPADQLTELLNQSLTIDLDEKKVHT